MNAAIASLDALAEIRRKQHVLSPEMPGISDTDMANASRWIRRVGRRVLIDEREFFAWVDDQSTERQP